MPTAQSLPDSASTIASGSTKMTPPNLATSSSPPRVTEPLASNQQPAQSTTNTATNNPFVVSAEDLLLSVPTPVIRLLIILSRPIAFLRKSIQVLLWRSTSPVESWLVVGSFWALALGGRSAWMYFLPPILVIPFLPLPTSPTLRPLSVNMRQSLIEGTTQSQPATTQTLLLTLSHLYAINGMISSTSVDLVATPGRTVLDYLQEWNEIEKKRLIRGGLILWIGWILANTLLGGRITFALLGSLVLLWPSPARKSLHGLCGKSLFLRRLATLAFLVIFGSPPVPEEVTKSKKGTRVVLVGDDAPEESRPPTTTFSVTDWMKDKWTTSRRPSFAFRLRPYGRELQSSSLTGSALAADDTDISSSSTTTNAAQGADAIAPSPPIYFRFELHENQRWWMGLDWTSALLPQERPSWCDMYLNPASPPSSFTLPGETVIYLPDPRKGDPNRRVKRTAKWRWIDEDWSAVKRTGKEALRSETAGGAGAVAGAGAGSGAGVGVGGGSGELGTPAHIRKSSSASLDIAENHAQAPAHASSLADKTTTTKGLAEQAFVKGLEKLKARTMSVQVGGGSGAGSGGIAGMGLGVRPHSGDFSHLNPNINTNSTDDSKHGDKAAGPGRPSEQTRKSSLPPPSDLSTMLGAATAFGHPLNPSSTGGQFGPTNNMLNQNVLAMLGDLDVGTDADGWSYGDNKWEGMGPKGGMGRVSAFFTICSNVCNVFYDCARGGWHADVNFCT